MKRRLLIVGLVLIGLLSVLVIRFYQIQVVDHLFWVRAGNRQHYFVIQEPYQRGTFYSNTELLPHHPEKPCAFVREVRKVHLYIDPDSIPDHCKEEMVRELFARVDLDPKTREQFYKSSRSRKLKMWMEPQEEQKILSWWLPFAKEHHIAKNALFFVPDYQRSYPFGKLLGQVLHTVQRQRDEKTKQAIPTGGLELYFDRELSGTVGKRRLLRSPLNALETGEVIAYPQHGADIYLTINHTLQAITEEELEKGVKKAKAKAGWAVMMEPQNGHILALAQYPFFDPSDYPTYFAHANLTEHTQVKAVTEAPEPGSSFKPITLAIALLANQELRERGEKELFHPDEKIATASGKFPGRSRPISDVGNHKFLNMQMGLQKSSNIYMARLVERMIQRLGDDWYRSALCKRFGLGEKTGIELPSESAGLIPRPGKKHPNGALEWSVPTPFSLAMGHNLQTNAIQFVRAMAVFANGGYLVQPTLIKKIVHGSEIVEKSPQKRQILPKEIVDQVVTAMKFATKKGGTARRADVSGYTEAGKSGTGEKAVAGGYARKTVCSNFIGFTPAKDPAFILLVVIDEPEHRFIPGVGGNHHGGLCAAPVFREIARRSLDYLGIPPDDPHGYPPGDPRYDPDKADWFPEVRKLQEKYNAWNF